jgi:hypothetical protein
MKRFRLSTLLLLVANVALGLAVMNLQGRLTRREADLHTLRLRLKRQGQYLQLFGIPGKDRDAALLRMEEMETPRPSPPVIRSILLPELGL